MPEKKAITHADLAPSPGSTDLGSKTAAFLMVLTILCGLFCFILCLIAEAFRSQVTLQRDIFHLCLTNSRTMFDIYLWRYDHVGDLGGR